MRQRGSGIGGREGRLREGSEQGRQAYSEEDLVLQVKNNELVYKLCIVMRRNVLFDSSMA